MSIPDPSKSRVVLVGVGSYSHEDLPDLRGVHAGAESLRDYLVDPLLGGIPAENCRLLPESASVVEIGRALRNAANEADELLMFYYAGHGLRGGSRHDLVLSVSETDPEGAAFEGVAFSAIRAEMERSSARSKVVIVDCCLAGRALGLQMAAGAQIGDEIEIDGVATLAAVPANAEAVVREGEDFPAYTSRLLRILNDGFDGAGPFLTIGDVKKQIHALCISDGLRPPQARTDAQIDQLALVRNRAYVPEAGDVFEVRGDIISQATELLADLEYPFALRDTAELLDRIVRWAGFYMNDDGLQRADGIDVKYPPTGRGRRHVHYTPGGDKPEDRQSRSADDDGNRADEQVPGRLLEVVDSVQGLLDSTSDESVSLCLDIPHSQYSASGWLQRELNWRLADEMGAVPRSVVVHPVAGRKSTLGLLVVWLDDVLDGDVLPYEDTDESEEVRGVLEVVARRVGNAIDAARSHSYEHQLAERLQQALLPPHVDFPGLDVWTYYAPNAEHAQVGGDWYDVLQISEDMVGLAIGDVAGHDVEAAATMGQLRSVLRSYAFELNAPGRALEKVDQLVAGMGIPRPASMVYAVMRKSTSNCWSIEYSRAGHLAPLLLRDGTVATLHGADGALVGFSARVRSTAKCDLQPGDTLLFYTDGLIERRDRSLRAGLEALIDAAAAIRPTDAAGVGEELLARFSDVPEDDAAIMVVRIPGPDDSKTGFALSPQWRRWTLPNVPTSFSRARQLVVRTCQVWGFEAPEQAQLVASELVSNSVEHAWGNIGLRLNLTDDGLRIEVDDTNPVPPTVIDVDPNRLNGFGMRVVDRLAEWGWNSEGRGKRVWAKLRRVRPDEVGLLLMDL